MTDRRGLFVVAVDKERGVVTLSGHGPRCGCCGEIHERSDAREFKAPAPERFWVGEHITVPPILLGFEAP